MCKKTELVLVTGLLLEVFNNILPAWQRGRLKSLSFKSRRMNVILPQSVSSLGEDADKEVPWLIGSVCGRHNDVVTWVQVQLPPHTPKGQNPSSGRWDFKQVSLTVWRCLSILTPTFIMTHFKMFTDWHESREFQVRQFIWGDSQFNSWMHFYLPLKPL